MIKIITIPMTTGSYPSYSEMRARSEFWVVSSRFDTTFLDIRVLSKREVSPRGLKGDFLEGIG